jgi:hypothetical protein
VSHSREITCIVKLTHICTFSKTLPVLILKYGHTIVVILTAQEQHLRHSSVPTHEPLIHLQSSRNRCFILKSLLDQYIRLILIYFKMLLSSKLISVIQSQVTTATNCPGLTGCMKLCYGRSQISEQSPFQSIMSILWVVTIFCYWYTEYYLLYKRKGLWLSIMWLMGNGIKSWPWCTIQ